MGEHGRKRREKTIYMYYIAWKMPSCSIRTLNLSFNKMWLGYPFKVKKLKPFFQNIKTQQKSCTFCTHRFGCHMQHTCSSWQTSHISRERSRLCLKQGIQGIQYDLPHNYNTACLHIICSAQQVGFNDLSCQI